MNLIVDAAICGQVFQKASGKNTICANATRLYKYLICDDLEELSANLKQYVVDMVRPVKPDDPQVADGHGRSRALKFQELYGREVLPYDLLELLNAGLGQWVHASTREVDQAGLTSRFSSCCTSMFFRLRRTL